MPYPVNKIRFLSDYVSLIVSFCSTFIWEGEHNPSILFRITFSDISDIIYSFRIQNCSLLYRPINQLSQSDGGEIWLDSKTPRILAWIHGIRFLLVSACPESFAALFRVFGRQRSGQEETGCRVFTPRFVAFCCPIRFHLHLIGWVDWLVDTVGYNFESWNCK